MNCDNCGACCLHLGVPPFDEAGCQPTDETDCEFAALPQELKDEITRAWEAGVDSFVSKPCLWFDIETRRCKHYEHRPVVCAEFEPGNPICLEDREWAGVVAARTAEEVNSEEVRG